MIDVCKIYTCAIVGQPQVACTDDPNISKSFSNNDFAEMSALRKRWLEKKPTAGSPPEKNSRNPSKIMLSTVMYLVLC